MSDELTANLKASRVRLPRSRGALGGVLLVIGGLWAGLVPFVGPYWNLAYTPAPDTTWKWTAARFWLEVLPGGVTLIGGVLLLMSTNRLVASFGGWLAALSGAWLVVGPSLAAPIGLSLGTPDPKQSEAIQATEALTFFYAIGAAIVLVAALALGRLSVHSVRDVQAAERRAAAAAEEERLAAERAEEEQRLAAEQQRAEHKRMLDERHAAERARIADEHRANDARANDEHANDARANEDRAARSGDQNVDLTRRPDGEQSEPLPVASGQHAADAPHHAQHGSEQPYEPQHQPPFPHQDEGAPRTDAGQGPTGQRPPDNPPPFYGNAPADPGRTAPEQQTTDQPVHRT